MNFLRPRVTQAAPPPTPEPAPAPPTIDVAARNQDYADRIRKRRGRMSTIMVGDNALGQFGPAQKTLLGS